MLGFAGEPYELRLLGVHQAENSAVALMTAALLHNLDERMTLGAARRAFRVVSWPGRFERMEVGGQTVILDGAHNPDGIRALRTSLDTYFPAGRRIFLLGILRDKDIDAMLQTLLRREDEVILTEPLSRRAAAAKDVADLARKYTPCVEACAADDEALERALERAGGKGCLIVAGSLYLVGDIRRRLLHRR